MIEITTDYLRSQSLSPNFQNRFWSKVSKTKRCWLWTGAKCSFGYGNIAKGFGTGVPIGAHVASWILSKGPIPKGMCVLHNCPGGDNPACVNPEHLWLGTKRENTIDSVKKGVWDATHPIKRGEQHSQHRLAEVEVVEMRKIYELRIVNQRQIACLFGVHFGTVSDIVRRKSWTHI